MGNVVSTARFDGYGGLAVDDQLVPTRFTWAVRPTWVASALRTGVPIRFHAGRGGSGRQGLQSAGRR